MQYMCLIYSAEGTGPQPGTDAFGPFMQGYQSFTGEMVKSERMVHGDALQPIATATTVTVRDGKTITTDGPFAETKEQPGGGMTCSNVRTLMMPSRKLRKSRRRPMGGSKCDL